MNKEPCQERNCTKPATMTASRAGKPDKNFCQEHFALKVSKYPLSAKSIYGKGKKKLWTWQSDIAL